MKDILEINSLNEVKLLEICLYLKLIQNFYFVYIYDWRKYSC